MAQQPWKIRKATHADTAGILSCLQAAFNPYRTRYSAEAFADTILAPATLQARMSTMSLFVGVSETGEILGTIGCHLVEASANSANSREGHIRGMAVLPSWQGSGIAGQLLKSAEAELRRCECAHITLDTTEPLVGAKRFYEKNGFRRSGKTTDFFGMPLFEYVKDLPK